jgi:hypothetical protein
MDERVRFVARLLEGEKMAALCREFAISRKTGYKIFDRYEESGLEARTDRSRHPGDYGNQLPQQVETAILHLKREKPHWGARKIRERLLRRFLVRLRFLRAAPSTPCRRTVLRAHPHWDKYPMKSVTYVAGTFCYPYVRIAQNPLLLNLCGRGMGENALGLIPFQRRLGNRNVNHDWKMI